MDREQYLDKVAELAYNDEMAKIAAPRDRAADKEGLALRKEKRKGKFGHSLAAATGAAAGWSGGAALGAKLGRGNPVSAIAGGAIGLGAATRASSNIYRKHSKSDHAAGLRDIQKRYKARKGKTAQEIRDE